MLGATAIGNPIRQIGERTGVGPETERTPHHASWTPITSNAEVLTTGVTADSVVVEASLADPAGFATLFDRHAVTIRRYLARRVGPDSAEDLTGETFLIAFSHRARYDLRQASALPWLYGIASNLVRQRRRAEVRQLRALARTGVDDFFADHADAVSARVAAEASTRVLAAALARLTVGERDVLLLTAWAGLSYDELAAALDIPLGTVRSRLHRARTKVRAALTDFEGEQR